MSKDHSAQLKGEELEHVRKLLRGAQDSLIEIARITAGKLNREVPDAKKIRGGLKFGQLGEKTTITWGDGDCVVYEDPPGICYPC
jgi:hypothetical protein